MDISTLTPDKQVKLQYWLDVIRQCRGSGLTNQVWCEQHDISLKRADCTGVGCCPGIYGGILLRQTGFQRRSCSSTPHRYRDC